MNWKENDENLTGNRILLLRHVKTKDATICFEYETCLKKKEQNNTKYDKIIIINLPHRNLFTLQQFSCKSLKASPLIRKSVRGPKYFFQNKYSGTDWSPFSS